jgi:hypothetical protein
VKKVENVLQISSRLQNCFGGEAKEAPEFVPVKPIKPRLMLEIKSWVRIHNA